MLLILDTWPFATISAGCLYLLIVACFFSTGIRHWISQKFESAPPSTGEYSATLDAYRGLAALLVATAHFWHTSHPVFNATQQTWMHFLAYGSKAVPIFVCLSGYLIFRSIRRIKSLEDIRRYVVRRFLRIYPAYFASVLLCIAFFQTEISTKNILAEIFMLRTFGYPIYANPVSWSVYVEVMFYLIAPLLVVFPGRVIFLMSALFFLVCSTLDDGSTRPLLLWRYFAIGIMASLLVDRFRDKLSEKWCLLIASAGLVVLLYDFRGFDKDIFANLGLTPRSYFGFSTGLAIACLLILVGSARSKIIGMVFGWLPFRVLGVTSYSLFLFHFFFLNVNFPQLQFKQIGNVQPFFETYPVMPAWVLPFVFIPGVIIWGMLAYLLIERPFLKRRPKTG